MKIITKAIEAKLRRNSADFQDGESVFDRRRRIAGGDHTPVLKLFTPWANCTWLITEMDEDDRLFGLCDLGMQSPEIGYVMLAELKAVTGPGGLKIERDRWFKGSKPISEYAADARQAGHIRA